VSRAIRLGAVSYLHARPLVFGVTSDSAPQAGDPSFSLRFDLPSRCAELLSSGDIDLGLVPSITYLDQPGHRIVPGVAIASDGPVASVALFTRRAPRDIRTLALDTSSRTSVALTRVLCARRFDVAPVFVPHGPDLAAMLAACDAALLIGDPALFADHRALGADKIDLGETWTSMTGLPFVWAFWVGGPEVADARVVRRLNAVRDNGVAASDRVADAFTAGDVVRQPVARRYLRENIRYDFGGRMIEGLRTYFREACALGLVGREGPLEFYPE
jgi:chorismate dehydratase